MGFIFVPTLLEIPPFEVVLVPLTAGSFNVKVTSNKDLELRKTLMDEGVWAVVSCGSWGSLRPGFCWTFGSGTFVSGIKNGEKKKHRHTVNHVKISQTF